jgi:hypothetical protein
VIGGDLVARGAALRFRASWRTVHLLMPAVGSPHLIMARQVPKEA